MKFALAIFKTFFKNSSFRPEKPSPDALRKIERRQSPSESEVLQMQTETIDKSQPATPQIEEQLIDTPVSYTHLDVYKRQEYQ